MTKAKKLFLFRVLWFAVIMTAIHGLLVYNRDRAWMGGHWWSEALVWAVGGVFVAWVGQRASTVTERRNARWKARRQARDSDNPAS